MKQNLLIFSLFIAAFAGNAQALYPIFTPDMVVTTEGDVDSPMGEDVYSIIDGDMGTKFLDFHYSDGIGFTVDLGGTPAAANRLTMITANDFAERDPMNYEIYGSNDGSQFTSIAEGSIPCIPNRWFLRAFNFTNSTTYLYYRIIFKNQCSPEDSLQIAEVQLYQSPLGVNDFALNSNSVNVYPNPSKGFFSVKLETGNAIEKVEIIDVTGKVIKTVAGNESDQLEVNTEAIANGVYFTKIYSNGSSVTKKAVLN